MKNKRREFLKKGIIGGMAFAVPSYNFAKRGKEGIHEYLGSFESRPRIGQSVMGLRAEPISQVRIGIIGLGNRGFSMMKQVKAMTPDNAKIVAVCDIRKEKTEQALAEFGTDKPASYAGGENEWKKLAGRDDLDLILIFTPWEYHVPMSLYAMQKEKHVAVEVPAALSVEDCWALVNTAEETQRNCMMLENVCYGDEELWVLSMVQQGVFGELTYGEAAYIHDLRDYFFKAYYKNWRSKHHLSRDGNLYPTHGLGPVAQYMDIQRGDKFDTMVSMSSRQMGMDLLAAKLPDSHEMAGTSGYKHGDMNNTLIKTAKGRTILLQHDVITPRPYNRKNALAGAKAYHEGYPSRLSVLGKESHHFLPEKEYAEYRERYRSVVWKKMEDTIKEHGGHGGMDFLMIYRLITCFNKGLPLDMDVYDGAAWSVVFPLSEISIQLGNSPVVFPDFTRGDWMKKRDLRMLWEI
ncbi:MAG: Gfo/Idh/MocA family oxidoreductase [Lewinellaceae bacterium]|nr:Gfo/Idh/MocA family oxidoreductase [Lewinellaceae bacterium]